MGSTALTNVPSREATAVAHKFGKLVAASVKVVEVADRTHEIQRKDGELVRPDGMSEAEWNIHCDAMKSVRNMPAYLSEHFRRVELAQRIAGSQQHDMPEIARFVVHLVAPQKYPTVDVTPVDVDGKE